MRLFAVNCLLLAISTRVSALGAAAPMVHQRVLDPSMMGPPEEAVRVQASGTLDRPMALSQAGLVFQLGSAMPRFTAVVWVHNSGRYYQQPFPFCAPARALGKAVGTTFLGPTSGTGNRTFTAAVPGAEAYPEGKASLAAIAYNLTCSAECTVSAGGKAVTHAAGTVKGAMLRAEAGADLTLTTTGTWELEAAVPQYARCYQWLFHMDAMSQSPIFTGGQWCAVFVEASVADGQVTLTYHSYYPDGCPVVYNEEAGTTAVSTACSFDATRLQKGLLCAPYAIQNLNLSTGDAFTAYGLKVWRKSLTEAERRFIVKRDRERMLRKGTLTEDDLLHDGEVATFSLRAPRKVHSPGEVPPTPAAVGEDPQ